MRLRISGPARRDIAAALTWSEANFGGPARDRYQAVIRQALANIATGMAKAAVLRPELGEGLQLYHLRHARGSPADVRQPRHLIAFRIEGDVAIILRLLHEAMDLPSHLRENA